MRELDGVEAESDDFFNHRLAIRVAAIVPASGEGEHEWGMLA